MVKLCHAYMEWRQQFIYFMTLKFDFVTVLGYHSINLCRTIYSIVFSLFCIICVSTKFIRTSLRHFIWGIWWSYHSCVVFLQRITIPEIKNHPWFLKNLPIELTDEYQSRLQDLNSNTPSQSIEEIMAIILEARKPAEDPKLGGEHFVGGSSVDLDDMDADADLDDVETSGDFVCAL